MAQQFGTFTASELYCAKCKKSMPVREKLLLVLPTGELYDFLCAGCASSLGQRTVSGGNIAAAKAAQKRRAQAAAVAAKAQVQRKLLKG